MIQENLCVPWPEPVREALARVYQGTLIPKMPLVYWADPTMPLWKATERDITDDRPAPLDGEEVPLDDDSRPRWGIVSTQTCYIQEEALAPRHPWIKLAPVVRPHPDWDLAQLRKNAYGYLHVVPNVPGNGLWVADLRLEVPVEKSWLVCRKDTCLDGFNNDEERDAFAAKLARLHDRPALATSLVEHFQRPLTRALKKLGRKSEERTRVLDPVEVLAFRIAGRRTDPTAIQLVVLSHRPLPDDVMKFFRDVWAEHVAAAGTQSFDMLPPDFQALGEMSAAEYRTLLHVPLEYLSPDNL